LKSADVLHDFWFRSQFKSSQTVPVSDLHHLLDDAQNFLRRDKEMCHRDNQPDYLTWRRLDQRVKQTTASAI